MNSIFHLHHQTHQVLAQYHRWYQVYEVPFTEKRIANQKDILSEEVEIISQAGTTKGKAGLEERLQVYAGWLNAHHVQQTEVNVLAGGQLSLEADIIYQNIRPDQSKYCYGIHYSALLQPRENELPVFIRIQLSASGEIKEFSFDPAYAENRCLSFLYYWLYLLETSGNEEAFAELLADDFSLHMDDYTGAINSPEKFSAWRKAKGQGLSDCFYTYQYFEVISRTDNTFSVSVDIDYTAVNSQGETSVQHTHQEWILENSPDDRFAKMKTLKITVGSSRVDLQACKLEYSIVSPK